MTTPRLVGRQPGTETAADSTGKRRPARAIPHDLLQDASRRLGILSLLGAVLWSVGTVLYHLARIPRAPEWIYWQSSDAIPLISTLLSLALYWVKREVESDVTFTQATVAAEATGTPAYMAPETALGQDVDGRADLYALGCVAYYLLTGSLVFDGQGLQQIVKRLQEDPVPPSRRTELPIPEALDSLVMSLLARDPAARPGSATEVRARLDAVPEPPWTDEQAAEWWRLHHGVATRSP